MKLYPEKLGAALAREIRPAYLLHGDEPLGIMEAGDQIRSAARAAGFEEREVIFVTADEHWQDVRQATDSFSLFASQRIIDLRLPSGKPGRSGSEVIRQLMDQPPEDVCFLITMPKLEKGGATSAWFKAIEKIGVTVAFWQPSIEQLPAWIGNRLKSHGLSAQADALQLLASQVEGNLLAARQQVEMLSLLYPDQEIDTDKVLSLAAKSARYPLGAAVDAALQGASGRALTVLAGLRDEAVPETLVLWSFTQDIRAGTRLGQALARGKSPDVAFREAGVWKNRQSMMRLALSRHTEMTWISMLAKTARIDRLIKGVGHAEVWDEFAQLCVMLAGDGSSAVADEQVIAGSV